MSSKISTDRDLKNSLIYMMPLAISMLLPLITLPIFTRILTTDDYGVLALGLAFAIFANGIVNFGTTLAYERNFFEFTKDKKKFSQLFYSCLLFINVNFLFIALLTFTFKENISYLFTRSYDHAMFFFLAFIAQYFFITLTKNYFTYLRNSYRSFDYAKYTILSSFLYFFLSLFFIVYLKTGIVGIIYSQIITGFCLFVILSLVVFRELKFSFDKTLRLGD